MDKLYDSHSHFEACRMDARNRALWQLQDACHYARTHRGAQAREALRKAREALSKPVWETDYDGWPDDGMRDHLEARIGLVERVIRQWRKGERPGLATVRPQAREEVHHA